MDTIILGFGIVKKEKIRQLYPDITQEDLCFIEGKEQIMIEILGHKLGISKEELRNIINEL